MLRLGYAQKRRWKVYLILALLGVLLIGYRIYAEAPQNAPQPPNFEPQAILQGNSFFAISPIDFPHTMVYGDLIGCLIKYESSGNPNAYNPYDTDGREKFGCLQFGEREFQDFCVKMYGLRNDIYDCDVQKVCADKMIADGYARKWGTLNKCVNN